MQMSDSKAVNTDDKNRLRVLHIDRGYIGVM